MLYEDMFQMFNRNSKLQKICNHKIPFLSKVQFKDDFVVCKHGHIYVLEIR